MVIGNKEVAAIFHAATDFESREERDAYVLKACGSDHDMLARVRVLLEKHDAGSFLDAPVFGPDVALDDSDITEGPGTVIGRYKLLEKIGEGGMAVVYMAEQEQPIRRKVALKIIKLGMDTKQVIARFEAERQALAMMDHANIAKVLDAGATETGRPYFVMELVTGVSITEYCDNNELSTRQRLGLFLQVCNAVQHAHQKGIIHRDLKPSNVMVTQRDGTPLPKVIDFGIAKATNQKLTEKTLFTRYAHIIGTPAYMSPEQAELSELDVDTRTDIYSLGVLLYELLTGTTPFSEEQLRKAGYIEMQRVIREEEPTKPSTKLSTLGVTLADVAKHRGSTPDLLRKAIRGDLDWIVMKSLEKVRDRRYDNASALAFDIQRHLSDEPVLARAPSTMYCLHKFLRRHRSQAVPALAIVLAFVAASVILLIWIQDRLQFAQAESLRHSNLLFQAQNSYRTEQYTAALERLSSILHSKHVGTDARILHDRILADAREQVVHFTTKIEANPEDANNYFFRAQRYDLLGEGDKARSDMAQYATIAGRGRTCDLQFGTAERLDPPVNSPANEWNPRLSADGLSLYFQRDYGDELELWMAARATKHDPWDSAIRLEGATVPVLCAPFGVVPGVTTMDGLELYGWDPRPGGYGRSDIYVMTRETLNSPWTQLVNLGAMVNSLYYEVWPSISPDGLVLYFSDSSSELPRPGGCGGADLWVTRRATRTDPWQKPLNLGSQVNSPADDSRLHVSADGLLLFFDSKRSGGFGEYDIYVSRRKALSDPWREAVNLGPAINTPASEYNPGIAPDGGTLFFVRNHDIWQAPITTIESNSDPNSLTRSAEQSTLGDARKEVVPEENREIRPR
ncbi:MAG: protein kinase [Phycisphaerales bacterium]|nr:MAG: protein kinase [Phycisphaerales bacterium]